MRTKMNENDGKNSAEKHNNSQDEGSIQPDKTQLDDVADDAEKKSEKSSNCMIWSQNVLKKAKISNMTREFRNNKEYKPNVTTSISEKMMDKNRYRHIFCGDDNRVVLKERDPSNDYIHASWMVMPDGFQFISTQGPIKNTIADFWHMVYTEKCHVIVMLCQYIEEDQEKCQRYFSDTSEKEYGDYRVKVVEKTVELWNPVKVTGIQVQKKNCPTKHMVYHYFYYDWHDQVAPLDPAPMIKMYKAVLNKSSSKPIVVHCSAGVGRTSTFVGIYLSQIMIRENSSVDMVEILKRLRTMRLGAVQSQLQYVYLVVLMIELFIDDKIIKRNANYESLLKKYADVTRKVTAAIMEEEEKRRQRKKREEEKEKEQEKESPATKEEKKKENGLKTNRQRDNREAPSKPPRKNPEELARSKLQGPRKLTLKNRDGNAEEPTAKDNEERSTAEDKSKNRQKSVYVKMPLSSKEKGSKHERAKQGARKNAARKAKKKPSVTGNY